MISTFKAISTTIKTHTHTHKLTPKYPNLAILSHVDNLLITTNQPIKEYFRIVKWNQSSFYLSTLLDLFVISAYVVA